MTPALEHEPRPDLPSIVCPRCGRRSYSRRDVEQRYCGACHMFHEDMDQDEEADEEPVPP